MRISFIAIGLLGSGFLAALLMGQSGGPTAKMEPPTATARLAAAEQVCKLLHDKAGSPTSHHDIEDNYIWSMRRMEAQRDVDQARGDRFSALEAHLQRMRDCEAEIDKFHRQKLVGEFELGSAHFYVVEAEELLAREHLK